MRFYGAGNKKFKLQQILYTKIIVNLLLSFTKNIKKRFQTGKTNQSKLLLKKWRCLFDAISSEKSGLHISPFFLLFFPMVLQALR